MVTYIHKNAVFSVDGTGSTHTLIRLTLPLVVVKVIDVILMMANI